MYVKDLMYMMCRHIVMPRAELCNDGQGENASKPIGHVPTMVGRIFFPLKIYQVPGSLLHIRPAYQVSALR